MGEKEEPGLPMRIGSGRERIARVTSGDRELEERNRKDHWQE